MSVYVDGAENRFGRMKMCHMIADSQAELLDMAHKIGVAEHWLQHPGTPREHFDICKSKRALALAHGALSIDRKALVRMFRERRPVDNNAEER